ncbi:long-chain fatty acid transport protein 2-like isoform X1 [Hoplias malabaricus]|uniref:long-chain fatty acid transport protein 2-like isoform X1 n=1 Tax=Hoplias malabaricus TaxID=27720 RepID=UPI0034626B78
MSVFLTLLVGLVLLPVLLRLCFPYFWDDMRYVLQMVKVALRLRRYRSSDPCYTILDCFLDTVKRNPEKKFLIFEGESYSYAEVDRLSNKVSNAVRAFCSVKEGDTVALLLGNEPSFVWFWLGLSKLGLTVSLLNHNIRSKSLLHCFNCCGASVLIAGEDLRDAVEEVLPVLKEQKVMVLLLADRCDVDGIIGFNEKIKAASDKPPPISLRSNVTIKSPALYIYTSGTTGLPKAAVISQERMWLATFFQSMCGVTSDDIIYICLPLYHSSGFLMGLTGAIERGITVVLRRKFSASQFWNDCRKHNVTVIQYIGEIMRYLCNTPKSENDRVHKVRMAIGNGIRGDTWEEFLRRFGDLCICECYGATEGNVGFVNYAGKIGATGRVNALLKLAMPFALIKYNTENEEPVRDSRGFCVEVPTGETGLMVSKITKQTPFRGYANSPEQTEKKKLRNVFVKGDIYYNSGDLMKIDEHGFVYFQDRIGDTFRWKGENVATSEVSDVLISMDLIEEANVYGVKVPGHEGRTGMAALKLMEGQNFDGAAVFELMENLLPSYARPRFIRIQEALNTTSTFKHTKKMLVEEGFDPNTVRDQLYFLLDAKKTYVPMTHDIFNSIKDGQLKL